MRDEYVGSFRMRFIGWLPDGSLMKFSPDFKKGEIRVLPYHYCKKPWWELAEGIPSSAKLVAPKGESVFEPDSNFVPFAEIEDEDELEEDAPEEVSEEVIERVPETATLAPQITSGELTKEELVRYIVSVGGEAKMSMKKSELQSLALSLGYPS